jgi:hypothetical protein
MVCIYSIYIMYIFELEVRKQNLGLKSAKANRQDYFTPWRRRSGVQCPGGKAPVQDKLPRKRRNFCFGTEITVKVLVRGAVELVKSEFKIFVTYPERHGAEQWLGYAGTSSFSKALVGSFHTSSALSTSARIRKCTADSSVRYR